MPSPESKYIYLALFEKGNGIIQGIYPPLPLSKALSSNILLCFFFISIVNTTLLETTVKYVPQVTMVIPLWVPQLIVRDVPVLLK